MFQCVPPASNKARATVLDTSLLGVLARYLSTLCFCLDKGPELRKPLQEELLLGIVGP